METEGTYTHTLDIESDSFCSFSLECMHFYIFKDELFGIITCLQICISFKLLWSLFMLIEGDYRGQNFGI